MRQFPLCFVLIALATVAFPQDRTNARSMVISPYGIVATSQVQASQAGAEILSLGADTRPITLWFVVICNEGGVIGASAEFVGKESLFRSALDHLEKYDTVGVAHWCDNGETQIDLLPTEAATVPSASWPNRSKPFLSVAVPTPAMPPALLSHPHKPLPLLSSRRSGAKPCTAQRSGGDATSSFDLLKRGALS